MAEDKKDQPAEKKKGGWLGRTVLGVATAVGVPAASANNPASAGAINAGAQVLTQTVNGTPPATAATNAGKQAADNATGGKVTQAANAVTNPTGAATTAGTNIANNATGGAAGRVVDAAKNPTGAATTAGTNAANNATGGVAGRAVEAAKNPTGAATTAATNTVTAATPPTVSGGLQQAGVQQAGGAVVNGTVTGAKKGWGFVAGSMESKIEALPPERLHIQDQKFVRDFVDGSLKALGYGGSDGKPENLVANINAFVAKNNEGLDPKHPEHRIEPIKSLEDFKPAHLARIFAEVKNQGFFEKKAPDDVNMRDEWELAKKVLDIKSSLKGSFSMSAPEEEPKAVVASVETPRPTGGFNV